jgi:hypothetical protein
MSITKDLEPPLPQNPATPSILRSVHLSEANTITQATITIMAAWTTSGTTRERL